MALSPGPYLSPRLFLYLHTHSTLIPLPALFLAYAWENGLQVGSPCPQSLVKAIKVSLLKHRDHYDLREPIPMLSP